MIAYITTEAGKHYLCVTDGGFQKWEITVQNLARLNYESAATVAEYIRGVYIPRHQVPHAGPIVANANALEPAPLGYPEE